MTHRIPESVVPANAVERTVSPYRREGNGIWFRRVECIVDGTVIAIREYEEDDTLVRERPVDHEGHSHGLVLEWHENGQMQLAEPYVHGLIHGTATQWHYDGTLLGTYTLDEGTGLDIWRDKRDDGVIIVTEIHTVRRGMLHGFQWWFDEDQSLYEERHFREMRRHGIEREWNEHGRLRRDSPRYWISNERVDKRRYLLAAKNDPTLPPFRIEDHEQRRDFPPEIRRVLEGGGGRESNQVR